MTKEIMTTDNERWKEFTFRLGGDEGCNFQEKVKGDPHSIIWKCDHTSERPVTKSILKKMGGIDIEKTMEYFNEHGGFCDCEVLFNVDCCHDEPRP